jgi:sugar lactone lactonase YvrE
MVTSSLGRNVMFTKHYTLLRRLSASVLTLLLFCALSSKGAEAQKTPAVTGSFATSLTAPAKLGQVVQTALDSYGDWLVLDYPNGALYEYPANGGAMITLAAPGVLGGVGSYDNPGIILDAQNNLYVAGNFNNCLLLFPYDTTTNTWDGLATLNTGTNTGPDQCGVAPFSFARYNLLTAVGAETVNYIQPWGLGLLPNNVLAIGSQDGANFIFTLPVVPGATPAADCSADGNCSPYDTPGTDNATAGTIIVESMTKRPNVVAGDKFGNIYFVEDSGGLSGAYMVPAGSTQLTSDTSAPIVRIDPNLANVDAVATDSNGNVYVSDSVSGVFLIPNPTGTPTTSAAIQLTPVPATGQVSVDLVHNVLYVPTTNGGLTKVKFTAQLGSTPSGTPAAASQPVLLGFNTAATPASFAIEEAGKATPDFTIATGGTCVAGTAYAAQSNCSVNVTLDPQSAGAVSGDLLALGSTGNILGSIVLHGTGTGPAAQILPGGESALGAGLKTPSQVAVDAAGNTYVADAGLGAVEFYPAASAGTAATTTIGTGLTAPTGVAVDGAGDVFIADSGNVYEVPNTPTGLNAAGQITLRSGLGTGLNLAVDAAGHLYVTDPLNNRVVKLINPGGTVGILAQSEVDLTGFNAPSAVAVDESGNLYVADGANLIEVTPTGTQTTLLSSLSGATGLALDPSGSVYVAESGGTIRIPNESGTLTASAQTPVAADVTAPTSVAVDSSENVYITNLTAENVDLVSASAMTNFGTLTSTTGSQANSYSVLNAGNLPLTVTGFSSTADYSETSSTCVGTPVAIDSTCTLSVTFNPGPGDSGTLTGDVLVQGNEANSPVGVNVTGVGAPLVASTTTVTVPTATVDGATAMITVAASSGSGPAPTGLVTLTVTGTNLTAPVTATGTLTAANNGAIQIAPAQLAAGTYTFTVTYQGDRVYGPSTATITVMVAVGAVTLTQPTAAQILAAAPTFPYLLSAGNGASEPYDSSTAPFYYSYPVTIVATDGDPLIGQPVLNSAGTVVGTNYGTVTYQIVENSPVSGGYAAGTSCLPVAVSSNGTAPFPTSCVGIDTTNTAIPDLQTTYTVTPMYSPAGTGSTDCNPTCVVNPNYSAVTGTPFTFTALAHPVVTISSNPTSLTVSSSAPATATLTLTSLLGYGFAGGGNTPASGGVQEPGGATLLNYTLPLQLACDGLPAYATCTFTYPNPDSSDPNSVAVGPAPGTVLPTTGACAADVGCVGPGTVMMTVNLNVPTTNASLRRDNGPATLAAMFGLGLLGVAFGKRRKLIRKGLPSLLSVLLAFGVMAAIAGVSGCSTKQLGTNNSTTTPAGTYAVLVTAKQVGSRTLPVTLSDPNGIVYGNGDQMSLPFTINVTVQ